ncbi:MAG TPA: GAF domain-containing protein [Verrucomicrobiae bacterium]|nr:GAF domain-containing protein [Verrucomicrobiae bacterium]
MTEPDPLRAALRAVALRAEAARRLTPSAGTAVLGSIVEATVALFGAEAASIALYDAADHRLVFTVAAGEHGEEVVGLAIDPSQGVAGYVFSTGQPMALADVAVDARFGRTTAEQTGYVPRSLVAVPLLDDEGTIGVLEVLDKRDGAFDLRDIELATVFARQATVAIRATRIERDTTQLLRAVLIALTSGAADAPGAGRDPNAVGEPASEATTPIDVEAIVRAATAELDADDDSDALWALADEIARLRGADPSQIDLVRELLAVLVRRAEHDRGNERGRGARRPAERPGQTR